MPLLLCIFQFHKSEINLRVNKLSLSASRRRLKIIAVSCPVRVEAPKERRSRPRAGNYFLTLYIPA